MQRALIAALVLPLALALAAPADATAQVDPCDSSAQGAFAPKLAYARVAVGRTNGVSVLSPDSRSDRSGDWRRDTKATVTLDNRTSARILPGSNGADAFIVPRRIGRVGATVTWTQTSVSTGGECARSAHVAFNAIRGKQPAATILGMKTGDYVLNEIAAGVKLGGCGSETAVLPVSWILHWTGDGSAPTRRSHTLRWGSPDPCRSPLAGQRLTGPRRVANKAFSATRAGQVGYETVRVLPAAKSRGMRGWWEVKVGGRLVKSTRFRYIHGSGFRRINGHRFPITGARLEHDRGPCPGLRCSGWIPFPGLQQL
jgi:hypothetical protein